ncbi:TlpA family protein disulfide reductase [Aequorivita marisscotiae]|jgi:peroxiredoxin|uniref:TlpA disulfide reductase family protein n=1 Tax=Aequorivita marisscotiae TaxID=3040348 RepID=A0ABY8KQ18_9FLAO|nr:TlpA disulfide reductase family protein [Aequorivita sp. Ant34-E75]WGF91560.1 TlpA disulfide reductase family protein [Aequorivita sp. Ant34-E75]HNP68843.1 TlpA disulfide reductase family protein [Aequorivita sp.]|tara:strand:+ start:275632 stop:276228 length:597 start_codon:yes stop_codon:yes gene_type:complete
MNKKLKKHIIEYGLFGIIILGIYFSGLHTEIIGFAQRGLLATGVMNPNVEQIEENSEANKLTATKADFNLQLMNSKGERVSMEQYRGKVIFINFWATWCPPCVAEMPSINKMYNDIDKDKIEVLMVSFDQKFEKAIKYKDKNNFNFEVYAPAAAIPKMYDSPSIPTTFIINSKGELIFTHKGMADYNRQDFKDFLKTL